MTGRVSTLPPLAGHRIVGADPQRRRRRRSTWSLIRPFVTLALLVAVGLGGAAGYRRVRVELAHHYPPNERRAFVDACTTNATASHSYCTCALGKFEKRYTLEQYRALESGLARGESMPAELEADVATCGDNGGT